MTGKSSGQGGGRTIRHSCPGLLLSIYSPASQLLDLWPPLIFKPMLVFLAIQRIFGFSTIGNELITCHLMEKHACHSGALELKRRNTCRWWTKGPWGCVSGGRWPSKWEARAQRYQEEDMEDISHQISSAGTLNASSKVLTIVMISLAYPGGKHDGDMRY